MVVCIPQRGGVIPAPLTRGGPKWRDNFPERSDHPVTSKRLDLQYVVHIASLVFFYRFFVVYIHFVLFDKINKLKQPEILS